jgi:acyl-CoA reductase-like NAD-dependent aldehyde dehydrogenase
MLHFRQMMTIAVYAEMGSVNPVFVLPGALADRAASIA